MDQVIGGLGNFEIQDFKAERDPKGLLQFEIQDFMREPNPSGAGDTRTR